MSFCKSHILLILLLFSINRVIAQGSSQGITLMFVGDVMGHQTQINSAYNERTGAYCYEEVFSALKPIFSRADFAIANLEVTLAGEPFTGYPQFSSPDELVDGLTLSGINVLVTANNHTVDRGKRGILRTIDVLENKDVPFAGAYRNQEHRDAAYPLVLEKNGIRIGLLNYTYGTNGIPVPYPTVVNLIDTAQIRSDYLKAIEKGVDEVIAFMHWGNEYQLTPSMEQLTLTRFMQELGIRIVIGSHPHVLQRMEASFDTDSTEGRVTVFSLGNFVSNQRPRYRNGGAIALVHIEIEGIKTIITHAGYILFWVHTPYIKGKRRFRVVPVAEYEMKENFFSEEDQKLFEEFIADSRRLFGRENYNVSEIGFRNGEWLIPWQTSNQIANWKPRRIVPWESIHPYPKRIEY